MKEITTNFDGQELFYGHIINGGWQGGCRLLLRFTACGCGIRLSIELDYLVNRNSLDMWFIAFLLTLILYFV